MRGFALWRMNEFTYDRTASQWRDFGWVVDQHHWALPDSLPEFVGRSHDSADTDSNSNRAGHRDPPCFCALEQVDFFNYSFV